MCMNLRFHESEIREWAERYESESTEAYFIKIRSMVQEQGYFDKKLLKGVANWKSPRAAHHVEKNDEDYVKEITSWSFRATNERARIRVLRLLDGVEWPTASAILHLFHRDPYPILDVRALWSIRIEAYKYSSEFWLDYVRFCRDIASRNQVDMRTLDKALWQYSKENQ